MHDEKSRIKRCWGSASVFMIYLAMFLALSIHISSAQKFQGMDFVPGQLVVGYANPEATAKAKRAFEQMSGAQRGGRVPELTITEGSDTELTITFPSVSTRSNSQSKKQHLEELIAIAKELKQDNPKIEYAHPNWIRRLSPTLPPVPFKRDLSRPVKMKKQSLSYEPNDLVFQYGLHWHYQRPPTGMNALGAWRYTRGSARVVVAVLDTGLLKQHSEMQAFRRVLPGYDFVSMPRMANDGDGRDNDPTDPGDACASGEENSWHGSHVAGTIGAATNNAEGIAGVTWNLSLLPVRVLGCGGALDSDVIDGLRWAAGLRVRGVRRNPYPAHIINLSLGGAQPCEPTFNGRWMAAIREVIQAGVVVIAAAGNENIDVKNVTPASCPGVISVAAHDRRGVLTPYSNYGTGITILAPGGDLGRDDDQDNYVDGIWSLTSPTRQNPSGIVAMQGTSMAAPHVAGAIALAMSAKPSLRGEPQLITQLLIRTADRLRRWSCRGLKCGRGYLNAGEFVRAVQ